jgi:putative transposase
MPSSSYPRFDCPRIARIISHTFGVEIDKNVVHRVLAKHHRPASGGTGPSWLSFIGQTTESLWSVDLFRCESIVLRSYWVLVVMGQFTRRLVEVGVRCGPVNAADLCCMFNAAIHGRGTPRHLSTDHDPLFEAHRWTANLRILKIDEIKTVPHVPVSHPFVERLVGTRCGENSSTMCCSGITAIWNGSWSTSRRTTTRLAAMRHWRATRP